jgi:thioredoxin-related protein
MSITPIFYLFALISAAVAESLPTPEPDSTGSSPREVALDQLLSERNSEKSLDEAIATARKAGISDQAILEARFLYHIDRREDQDIAAMLPDFIKQRENFKLTDSAIFSVKEDWLAVNEYVEAITCLKKGDKDAFKNHITEAFWLSPRQASAFAPHIDRMRLEESMRSVKIDFEVKYDTLNPSEPVTFKSLIQDKKAMLLQFWSPASRECESSLADYATTAKTLTDKGIAMVSILTEDSDASLTNAQKMILPLGEKPPGSWLIDQKEKRIAHQLRVQALPTFVLISNGGQILFNGDPTDDGLWEALKKLDSKITRPDSPTDSE